MGAVHQQRRRNDSANRRPLQRAVDRVELLAGLGGKTQRDPQAAGLGDVLRQPRQRRVGDLVEKHAQPGKLVPLSDFHALTVNQLIHQSDRLRGDRAIKGCQQIDGGVGVLQELLIEDWQAPVAFHRLQPGSQDLGHGDLDRVALLGLHAQHAAHAGLEVAVRRPDGRGHPGGISAHLRRGGPRVGQGHVLGSLDYPVDAQPQPLRARGQQ